MFQMAILQTFLMAILQMASDVATGMEMLQTLPKRGHSTDGDLSDQDFFPLCHPLLQVTNVNNVGCGASVLGGLTPWK